MPSDLVAPSTGVDGTAQVAASTLSPERESATPPRDGRGWAVFVALAVVVTLGAIVWMLMAGGGDEPTETDEPAAAVAELDDAEPQAADPAEPDVAGDATVEPPPTDDEGSSGSDITAAAPPAEEQTAPVDPIDPAPEVATDDGAPPPEEQSGDAAATEPEVPDAEPVGQPQSRAAFRDGQVVLFGKVPSREIADEIFDLAASLLGPENVIDEYEIDPTVPPPTTGNLTVEETIEFSSGAAVLPEPVPDILPIGVALMVARPTTEMRIIGHTDGRGSEEANLRLSLARADAVKAYLVEQGIDPARIETVGFGEAFPVASDDTEEGRRQNRRIEFEVQNILGDG